MRIIKFILTRLKMLLDRFFLNTDYDTQKESEVVSNVISGNSFDIVGTSPGRLVTLEADVAASAIPAFENITVTSNLFPTTVLMSDYSRYDDGNIEYSFFVTKPTSSAYHFKVRILNYSGHTITIPDYVFTANIHRFVPSSQDS